jgi:hydrogenase maturation factor
MCHVNKGGVFGALWEMADRAGIGLSIDLKAIPVKQETIEISEIYDVNPYEMLGTGSLLMIADDGHELVRTLQAEKIPAAVIGKTTADHDRVILNEGESRFLEPVKPDEILKVL